MFITACAAYKKRKGGKAEEEHKYKYGWIHGEGEIFFYHHYLYYKSVNVGIIIYRSRKKWHELWSALQRLGKIVYMYIYIHICVLHDVHFTYIKRNERKKLWRGKKSAQI